MPEIYQTYRIVRKFNNIVGNSIKFETADQVMIHDFIEIDTIESAIINNIQKANQQSAKP